MAEQDTIHVESTDEPEISEQEWQIQKLLGRELRRIRESQGMTRAEVASSMLVPCSEELVAQYEDGSVPMEIAPVFDMTRVLHVHLEELLPQKLMAQHLADGYLELDEESRYMLDRIVYNEPRISDKKMMVSKLTRG